MLGSLKSLRLSRKRGSEALEDPPTAEPSAEPSPSNSPKPASKPMTGSLSRKPKSNAKPRSSLKAPPPPPDTPEVTTRKALQAIVRSLPPKTFHNSVLSRLQDATPDQVSVLTQILDGVEPPSLLHCARCHSNYYEEENVERSCVMDHDDNSTEVKHGETTWGCCGHTVDGEDTPLGWCYEGKHTDDRAKARYREDYESDGSEDGLQTCEQHKCKRRVRNSESGDETHVVVTRRRGERLPPTKRKRTS
ncbi:hypothetical protein FRB95_004539 [Tulasnella sp. JGI-2019a]|nr:hypothetical protein FRB95_004539 [Tulasnella sp. JGI-2019a]